MPEYKSSPQYVKAIEGRDVTGIFAVHGNVDSGLDRSWPGAFSKTIQEQSKRVRFLWNHDFWTPPVAAVKSIREVTRAELPPAVLEAAPDAAGGVEVTRSYLETERGSEILAGIKAGAINEMSYGYDAVKFDFTTEGEGDSARKVRELREVKLLDISDVNWGMNHATIGSKMALPDELLSRYLHALMEDVKAGRRNSASDAEMMKSIHDMLTQIEPSVCSTADEGKSRAETLETADFSLTHHRAQLQQLEMMMMR